MLTLFVKEIPTDITKLETKNIRKTRSTANQFDAETLTQALQTKVERHAQSQLQNGIIVPQRDSYGHHKTGNKNHQILDPQKSISCRHNEPRTWINETKCTQSQLKHYHCSSKRFLYTSRNWNQKSQRMTQSTVKQSYAGTLTQTMLSDVQRNARTFSCKTLPLFVKEIPTDVKKMETKVIWKTRSTANQFDAGTLTEALQTELEKNAQTVSYNMLLLFVKEIPTDITKLETKIIKYSIHKKSISCRHIETRSWTRIETKITQSQLKHYHCSSRDSYIHHETGTKNHNGGLNLRLSNLMLGHRLKRCYPMCNEMHWHPAAKCYHCLSKRIQRTTQNWEQKSSERHNPQQINLMLRHWLKHYKLKWNEMHRQSATTC